MSDIEALVNLGLDQLSEGFGIFDEELRLVYCNRFYRELRRYPEALCLPGSTLESMIRFNAERGDFGVGDADLQVTERMAEIQDSGQRTIEREMADGQILKIRYQHLNGGGLTVTFEDKTEERQAQKAQAASEERHALVAQATSDGLYDWDVVNDVLYVSGRLNELFEFEVGNIASIDWADRVHKSDYPHYIDAVRAHLKNETDHMEVEYRTVGKAGDFRWVRDRAICVRGEDQRAVRMVGAVTDITDFKQAEDEIGRAEKRLLDSLDTISDGFLLVDADDKLVLRNKRYLEIFGSTSGGDVDDLVRVGRPFLDIVRDGYDRGVFLPHPGGVDEFIAERRAARQAEASDLELQLSNKRWILINERRMSDGGKVSVYADITEFKRRHEETETARARFEDAIEAISSGFVLYDSEDRMITCNAKYLEYFSDLADIVVPGKVFRDIIRTAIERGLFPLSKDDPEGFLEEVMARRSGDGALREQYIQNGTWLQISDHRTSNGGIASIYTDITELKQRQADLIATKNATEQALRELQQAQDRLVQAEKMASLGQLTAGIAHEIKNPLNFINNFSKLSSEMLDELAEILEKPIASLDEEGRDDAEDLFDTVKGNLDKIEQHGRRADSIVKNMLLHSREGSSEMHSSNLNGIAEEALNLAYHGARAENSDFNIEMVTNFSEDMGKVDCFPQDLMRVFLNLISNGMYAANKRKASPGKSKNVPEPTISVETRVDGENAVIEIRDNGDGIPDEIREQIFTPFFTTKPAGEGTGLGLSLSYDIIVKQHGGTMSVDSEAGEFTTFVVTIPRVMADEALEGGPAA